MLWYLICGLEGFLCVSLHVYVLLMFSLLFSACLFCSILVGLFASLFSNKREKEAWELGGRGSGKR